VVIALSAKTSKGIAFRAATLDYSITLFYK
jgi:hypothetical protein